MNNLHVNWYLNAVNGLVNAIGKRTLKQASYESQMKYNLCLQSASDLTKKAKCLSQAIDDSERYGNKQWHPLNAIKKSGRTVVRKRRNPHRQPPPNNSTRKPSIQFFGNALENPITPSTTPYPSPLEALSRLVINAMRDDGGRPAPRSPTMSRLRQLHSLVERPRLQSRRKPPRLELLSPRFAPLMPSTSSFSTRIYSPSLLSFYKDSAIDNLVSLPDVLENAGMPSSDQEALLEMMLEVSGARRTIDEIFEVVKNEHDVGLDSKIMDATLRIEQAWNEVRKTFSWRQNRDFREDGYTFLRRDQLEHLYGENGLYQNSASLNLDLDEYERWTSKDKEVFLKNAIRQLASDSTVTRRRRELVSPPKSGEGNMNTTMGEEETDEEEMDEAGGGPTTLAPFAFTASVLSISILGPVTLSPSLFTPAILSPALLGPTTLSPSIGNPAILSPYVLGPQTLSPGILAPSVLSPYVLSPNIINFFVLSPSILSPAVLSPEIYSPTVLSPNILSPLVLSPSIESEPLDGAPSILSPSVLSK